MNKTYWYAVETRVRSEYAALREISARGFETYLPQRSEVKRTRKGRVAVCRPLMPGFLFVGTNVPPILDVNSPDHPHPIFQILMLRPVRDIVRGAGGGIHPLRSKMINGAAVTFVEHLRALEEAGEFHKNDQKSAKPTTPDKPFSESFKDEGDYRDQLMAYEARIYPDVAAARRAA